MQKQLGGSAGMFPNGQNINLGWSKFQTFPGEHNPRLLQQYISYYLFILRSHTSGCVVPDHLLYPGYTTSTDLAAWSPASNFKVLSWHSPEPSLFWHPKLSFLVSFSWSVGLWLPDPLSPHIYWGSYWGCGNETKWSWALQIKVYFHHIYTARWTGMQHSLSFLDVEGGCLMCSCLSPMPTIPCCAPVWYSCGKELKSTLSCNFKIQLALTKVFYLAKTNLSLSTTIGTLPIYWGIVTSMAFFFYSSPVRCISDTPVFHLSCRG